MNTRFRLVLAALVGLTFFGMPVLGETASNAQSRYSIITEDDVPGEVVQLPRKKKKTAPEAPEAQKKQPSGSNYSSRSQAEAKKMLLDESIAKAEPRQEQTVAVAGSPTLAVKKKKKAIEIFDLFGSPVSKANKR